MDRLVPRRLCAAVLAGLALLCAFDAARARRVGNGIAAARVTVGESPEGAPDPGNAEPFEPFAFGVVGPLRGSHAALQRALDSLGGAGGVDFVVLLGDVTATGSESELLRLAATWRAAGVERIAVAGPGDREPGRVAEFEAYVSPTRWWFQRYECLFLGVSGEREDDARFAAGGTQAAPDAQHVFAFSIAAGALDELSPSLSFSAASDVREDVVPVHRVQVLAEGGHAVASWEVGRGPTPGSLVRDVELGLLFPLVGGGIGGLIGVLAACAICLGLAFRLARRPRAAGAAAT